MHYRRWKKHGDPAITTKAYRLPERCSVSQCELRPIAKGLCGNHYALNRRNGVPERTRVFTDAYMKDGYRYVRVGRRHYEPEHRLVMERCLNRKLASEEQVHHVDGDTLNNSPSNLQIVSRSEHMRLHVPRKLTYANVKTIRARLSEGVPIKVLAGEYGVTRGAIHLIARRKNWKHVA